MAFKLFYVSLIVTGSAIAQTASVSSITPNSVPARSPSTSVSIVGTNIAPRSVVSWTRPDGNKVTITPSLIQAAQLAATIPAALLTTEGTAQVAVADPAGVLSNQLPFAITPGDIGIGTTDLPDAQAATPYAPVTLSAIGGTPPYTWVQTGGATPSGLSLDPKGVLSGTPSTPGTYAFGARATDSAGATAAGTFSIKVNPLPLRITTPATLTSGVVGQDYPDQTLSAAGGIRPYTFAVDALPDGLIFSAGEITGTPTTAGAYSLTVTVTDSTGAKVSGTHRITIRASGPVDLVLGASGASFQLTTGSAALPAPTVIPVSSSSVGQLLTYSVAASSASSWFTVTSGPRTPGSIRIALSNGALSLEPSATPYQGSVVVTCTSPSPCAGSSQTIVVSVTVVSPPAQLSVDADVLIFSASSSSPQRVTQSLAIENSGAGLLNLISIDATDKWLSIGNFPATVPPGPGITVSVTADPAGLTPGVYRSAIRIVSSAGRTSVPVRLVVSADSFMTFAPAGTQFTMPAGGVLGNPKGSFLLGVSENATKAFTASVLPGAAWLQLQTPGGIATGGYSPASVNFSIDPAAAARLAPGSYYGAIRVVAEGVVNSPQDFQVVLVIAPAASRVIPDPQPTGLVFVSGGNVPAGQTVQVYASSQNAVQYQASASTSQGGSWLSVSPTSGITSASAPGQATVTVDTASLQAGVYRGGVNYSYAGSAVRTVNVTLIVPPPSRSSSPSTRTSIAADPPGCAPTQLVPVQAGPISNFVAPASWPTPLAMRLLDDCGASVPNGQVVATFSNGDPPLTLSLVDGAAALYSATWTPRNTSAQVTIAATAVAPGFAPATAEIAGQVKPNAAPVISPNAVLHIFDPQIGGALAPGTVVQIYGDALAAQPGQPPTVPLPNSFGGTSVLIGGIESPLFYVAPGQINAQVPFELAAGRQYQVIINANGALSTPVPIQLNPAVPGVVGFLSGQIIAQHPDYSLVLDASPAKPGEIIVLYVAGMGNTDNPVVTSGAGSPGLLPTDKLAHPLIDPALTLDGVPMKITFSGLTPGAVGLYQVNFQVPVDATDGNHEVVLSQPGATGNKTLLPVHK